MNIKVANLSPTSSDAYSLLFLGQLIRFIQPQIIVEAGTYRGNFAVIAASILRQEHINGEVYTADPLDHGAVKCIEENDLDTYIHFIQDDFEQIAVEFPHVVGKVGFAFIDSGPPFAAGDENFEIAVRWRHYEAVKGWMAPSGIIAVDDTLQTDWFNSSKISAEAGLNLRAGKGLSLWQKPLT
jgi:predicted O-methyltransferase YrrM